ncbi:NAD(P)H-nitrite reductase [Methylophaga lonarensis MPL]|uniref:Bacterioferritin-associated ferredoxin n=1 Tax=Methylophaga lonarensis MPL TaxID=1286106 RepID=M7PF97_9GAMM|nr:(2Fe-2S)-binding protein [Methylophaga lonarensis]EMR12580.1 NAD(P)H-nitrite reductase [Methylophaga lonarensis MPL]
MIVCICNNVNVATIESAVVDGAATVDAIRQQTGAAGCCGKCQFKVNRVLQKSLDNLDASSVSSSIAVMSS